MEKSNQLEARRAYYRAEKTPQKQNAAMPTKDIKGKTIFHNPVLCCQFLRNYVDHPLLKNIQPEDYTEHYISYFGVEFESDTVKRIRIFDENGEKSELYLISLIEHKSRVDYKDQVKTKSFRYPPILPVVYHEGTDTWSALMHLKERIFMYEVFAEYIPDFTYLLVNNHDFSNKELLEHKDEMSQLAEAQAKAQAELAEERAKSQAEIERLKALLEVHGIAQK